MSKDVPKLKPGIMLIKYFRSNAQYSDKLVELIAGWDVAFFRTKKTKFQLLKNELSLIMIEINKIYEKSLCC